MAKTSTPSRSFQMMFALLFVLLAGQLAFSSTPSSGALNPAVGSSVSWTGSSVGGATTDETTCVDGTNCDVFTITLTGLPSNYSGLVLSVHIGHNVPANDYDLHVHKGGLNGPVVASSTMAYRKRERPSSLTRQSLALEPTRFTSWIPQFYPATL